jgi:hypothetical protein
MVLVPILSVLEESMKRCPHCGGLHFGQRFDDCPYAKLARDPHATQEQRRNSQGWLDAFVDQNMGGEGAAFDCSRLNQSKTGYLLVKGGFPDAESAKAFVDGALPFPK